MFVTVSIVISDSDFDLLWDSMFVNVPTLHRFFQLLTGPAARTQCEPAFSEGDSPMNPNAVWESPTTMLQGEFEVQKV